MSTDDDAAPSCVHFWGRNFITSVLSTMYFFLSHSFWSYSYFTCEAAGTTTYGSNRRVQGIVGAVLPTTYTMTGFATSQNISAQHWSLAVIDCDGSIHAGSRMPTHISYYQYQPGIRKKLKYTCAECENLLTPSIQNQDPGNHEYPRC
jgi:hypothetical protein